MSPTLGDTHHDAVRFPPAEPSDRHVRVGPVNMICPCLLTPVQTPRKATNASRAFSALALGHGWPGEQVPSSSLAAIPAKRSRGPSSHQIGPSPSQTWEGVHLKVSPREMTGTSAFAPRGPITKTANLKIAWGMRNFVMAESFMFLVYHEFRILFAASDTAKRKVQTRVLQVQRMSGMTGRDAASEVIATALGRPLRTAQRFRFQWLPQLPRRLQVQRQDIAPCCPSWCDPAKAEQHAGCPSSCRFV